MEQEEILKIAIKKLSLAFDSFLLSCVDGNDCLKTPDLRDFMAARGCLPEYCKMAFRKHNPAVETTGAK